MRNNFAARLFEIAEHDKSVMLITGDLGYGVLTEFQKKLPRQFFNAGIAEQNMISVAAGMGLDGKNVFVYSIANFPTLRPLEQIRNDVCYHNANVKIVSVGGGFAYGSLGMSHHGTEDLAIMRALPNMRVMCPADKIEAIVATDFAYGLNEPCYIRLGKGGEPDVHKSPITNFDGKSAFCLHEGKNADVVIFTTGSIAEEAIEANKTLSMKNKDAAIYSFLSVKPIDERLIKECAAKYKKIITVEEHNIIGGFGSAVAEILAECDGRARLHRIGLKDVYSSVVGSQMYLRKKYGISASDIVEAVLKNE